MGVFGSARRRARAVFAAPGPGRVEDPLVTRVQSVRALLGALATFGLISVYGVDGGWSAVVDDGLSKLFLAPVVLIVLGPVVVACFIWYAPRRHRPLLRSRLRHPLKAVGWYLGAVLALVGCVTGYSYLNGTRALGSATGLLALATGPLALWLILFLVFASGSAARYAFNTADVHAALPAVLTVVLVWALALLSLGDGLPNGPTAIRAAAFLGGPVSVTAVALWELWFLRKRYGVRIRG
ncbi:hypothetical protein [Streptomyces mobaraensis]|uniref:Uncharacterized protein n=1 Tax=Streptomyces mobaraensis TaxID=35621 RepID=A0A5N5W731_STRMB|nr:hypothetical protein [Streptomyces mobaraensis]KAB7843248.1 hypothetical protein FRZ00_18035 [Streptomyces mobaraensis]